MSRVSHDFGDLAGDGAEADLSRFDGSEVVVLTAAESPRKSITYDQDGPFFRAGTTVVWPSEVVLRHKPESVRRIEVELVGDLVLCLGHTREEWKHPRNRYEDHAGFVDELVLRSMESPNVAVIGPAPAELVVDGPVLGVMVGHIECGGEDKSELGSRLRRVTFVQPPRPASLGQVVADVLVLPASTRVLDLTAPGPNEGGWHFREVSLGQIERPGPGLVVRADRTINISKLPDGCSVEISGCDAKLVLGREAERALVVDVKVSAPKLHLVRGVLDGVSLVAVAELEVGPTPPKEDQSASSAIGTADESALPEVVGMATATRVIGQADRLTIHSGCTVAGDILKGFCAQQLSVAEQSEISGLAAQPLSTPAIAELSRASRSGLWVPWSSRAARREFEGEARKAQQAGELELGRLSNRRARLLEHAVTSSESGHVLSVLREAEKDSRRRLLPMQSRERLLLEMSRWMVGYGERIGWPLGVGALLLAVLAGLKLGWSNLTASEWWSGFAHVQRYESAFEFALPGIDELGIEASDGLWGLLAKLVSVVFIATAVRAGFRVLRRRE